MIRTISRFALPIYGLIMILGGWMAYRDQQSQETLIAGGTSGVLAIIAGLLASRYPRFANGLATIVALVVAGIMGWRWEKTGYIIPAGILATLSGGMATLTTSALIKE